MFGTIKYILFILLSIMVFQAAAQNPLSRKVTVNAENVSLENALVLISQSGHFFFSYNADILPLDKKINVKAQQQPVEEVLKTIIPDADIKYKAYNTYIIIYQEPLNAIPKREKQKYIITGYILDARTGDRLSYASIYETRGNNYALTDADGQFTISGSTEQDFLNIAISKRDYLDTVIVVRPALNKELNIQLLPQPNIVEPLQPQEFEQIKYTSSVEEVGLVGFFVPEQVQMQAQNILLPVHKFAQISLIPLVSSNGLHGGIIKNNLSLNVLAGYNYGTEGVELGGFMNINRRKMAGIQLAGFGNVVGGKTYGIQIAGFTNTSLRSVYGFQLAGFTNYAQDTVTGFQIAGFNNTLVGRMKGAQISGFNNIATREFDGVQIAGFSNLAIQGVVRFQGAGFLSYAQKVTGIQAAGFSSVAIRRTQGLQASGFGSYSRHITGLQASGFLNITSGEIKGVQAGFMNYATDVKGFQLGFLNISDSVKGLPIGIISYVHSGYHHLQISGNESAVFQAAFKTGVPKFYNILQGGAYLGGSEMIWSVGYGIGTSHTFAKKLEINFDFTANTLTQFRGTSDYNILAQADLQFAYKFRDYFSIFAGPGLNWYWIKGNIGDLPTTIQEFAPENATSSQLFNNDAHRWLGWKLGIRI